MIEEIKNIKSGKKELREFGLTIGIILVILGAVALWRGKTGVLPYFVGIGTFFIIVGFAVPGALKPFQKTWMGFAIVVGSIVSPAILTVLFYGAITPIGLITRVLRKDILGQRIDKSRKSYWHDREDHTKDKKSYENQY